MSARKNPPPAIPPRWRCLICQEEGGPLPDPGHGFTIHWRTKHGTPA